jgi:hypothetical protein
MDQDQDHALPAPERSSASVEFHKHGQKSALERNWQMVRIALKRTFRPLRNALLAVLANASITANPAHGNIELSLWNPQLSAKKSAEASSGSSDEPPETWSDFLRRTDNEIHGKSAVLSTEAITLLEGEELPLEELWRRGEHLVFRLTDLIRQPHPEKVEQRLADENQPAALKIMDTFFTGFGDPKLSLRSGDAVIQQDWRQEMLGGMLRVSTNIQLEPDMTPLENLKLRVVFSRRWAQDLIRLLAEGEWDEEKGSGIALGVSWERFLSEQARLRISVDSDAANNHQISIGFSLDWGGSSHNGNSSPNQTGRRRSSPLYVAGKAARSAARWEQ